jgi:hypothetical protein
MRELRLRTREEFEAIEESLVFSNKCLTANFPRADSYSVAWSQENISPQEFSLLLPQKVPYFRTPFVALENSEASEASSFRNEMGTFTQTNLLDYEEDQIQEAIFRIRTSLSVFCRELANRLLALFHDAKEEEVSMNIDSFRNFFSFFQLTPNLKCPTISLTPENDIYASWKGEQNRLFSVHFLPEGSVRFVVFKPNDRHPEQQIRLSGTATSDILMETVAPYGIRDWISE